MSASSVQFQPRRLLVGAAVGERAQVARPSAGTFGRVDAFEQMLVRLGVIPVCAWPSGTSAVARLHAFPPKMERCDHEGTTEPLGGSAAISFCTECGKTWPSRFGAGAPTVRVIAK